MIGTQYEVCGTYEHSGVDGPLLDSRCQVVPSMPHGTASQSLPGDCRHHSKYGGLKASALKFRRLVGARFDCIAHIACSIEKVHGSCFYIRLPVNLKRVLPMLELSHVGSPWPTEIPLAPRPCQSKDRKRGGCGLADRICLFRHVAFMVNRILLYDEQSYTKLGARLRQYRLCPNSNRLVGVFP